LNRYIPYILIKSKGNQDVFIKKNVQNKDVFKNNKAQIFLGM